MVASRAANSETFKVSTPSDLEIRMTRLFSAPQRLVFDALTRPEHVKRWWGILDENHSVPVCEIDLRPGGAWRFVARGPQGDTAFYGVYREIKVADRIVNTEIFEPYPEAISVVTTELAEEGGKTRVTVTSAYPSIEVRNMVLESGMEHGAAISYDRLEAVVAGLQR
jgi:uncharacterized protein YndB with AHSA1/START domain